MVIFQKQGFIIFKTDDPIRIGSFPFESPSSIRHSQYIAEAPACQWVTEQLLQQRLSTEGCQHLRMKIQLALFCLLLPVLSQAEKGKCPVSASSCDECIQAGPECAWCMEPGANVRCHSKKGLRRQGCSKRHIYDPQSSVQALKNDSSTGSVDGKTLFLQPQEVSLHLRPGGSQSFPLIVSMPTDQPIMDVTMDASLVPAGVNITFSSMTKGNPLHIQVNVEAAQCPSDGSNQNLTGPWSVLMSPRGFSLSATLKITLLCGCECTGRREENSPACRSHGEVTDNSQSEEDSSCHSRPNAPVCSGNGKCVEGFCECAKREDPNEMYHGTFCQCDNFNCPRHNNSICGGNGRCECGRCLCDSEWVGDDCSCSMETASCMAGSGQLCNGRGDCNCGICQCSPPYSGPTCEECPSCHNVCGQHAACVECRTFKTGAKAKTCDRDCDYLTVTMEVTGDDFPRETEVLCKRRTLDSCFLYTLPKLPSRGQSTWSRVKRC
ncbi:integrin beta-1-like isoform 2-T2 [Menidia menidia]